MGEVSICVLVYLHFAAHIRNLVLHEWCLYWYEVIFKRAFISSPPWQISSNCGDDNVVHNSANVSQLMYIESHCIRYSYLYDLKAGINFYILCKIYLLW